MPDVQDRPSGVLYSWSSFLSSLRKRLLIYYVKTEWERSQTLEVTVLQLPSSITLEPSLGIQLCAFRLQDSHILAWTTTRRYRYFTIALVAVRVVLGYDAYYRSQSFTLSYKLLIDRAVFPYDYPGQLLLGYHM